MSCDSDSYGFCNHSQLHDRGIYFDDPLIKVCQLHECVAMACYEMVHVKDHVSRVVVFHDDHVRYNDHVISHGSHVVYHGDHVI